MRIQMRYMLTSIETTFLEEKKLNSSSEEYNTHLKQQKDEEQFVDYAYHQHESPQH